MLKYFIMHRLFLVVLIGTFACVGVDCPGWAQGAGSTAGIVLTQSVSAKTAGIAEAGVALAGEIVSIQYNPAGLALLTGSELSVMYQKTLTEDTFGSAIIGGPLIWGGSLALSVAHYTTGKVEMYDTNETLVNKVGQRDTVYALGYGFNAPVPDLDIGLAAKAITSEIFGHAASAFAGDIGFQYAGLMQKHLRIGAAVQNIGSALTYIEKKESLPQIMRAGAAYTFSFPENSITGYCDFPYYVKEQYALQLLGIAWEWNQLIVLRAGYRANMNASSQAEESFNGGAGIAWGNYTVDYAVGITDNLSMPHYISLRVKF